MAAETSKRASTLRKEQLARLTADVARAEVAVAKAGERLIAAREREARAKAALAELASTTKHYASELTEAQAERDAAVAALTASLTGEVAVDDSNGSS